VYCSVRIVSHSVLVKVIRKCVPRQRSMDKFTVYNAVSRFGIAVTVLGIDSGHNRRQSQRE